MSVPREILQWIDQKYPKPRVDREWLQGCYEWAIEEPGVGPVPPYPPKLFELIEDQLLKSNLSESMDLETGLPHDIGDFNKTLTLPATSTLVEITSLTEIGYSAFQLDQIRKAREERIQAGLDEYGEGEEDADIEIEGEGPMPKYPRGMLSFVLSDGKTSFKACEYRTLHDLSLVRTPLGFKMHLKNVRVVRGVAHLEPKNVTLLGGHSDLQALKSYHFRQNLRQRMNLPPEPMPERADENAAGVISPPLPPAGGASINGRAPLQEISPPPSPSLLPTRNDDEELEPRRRRVPSTSSTLIPSVSRSQLSSTSPYFHNTSTAGPSNTNLASSMALSPTLRQSAPTRNASPPMSDLDVDWAILDEMERDASNTNNINGNNKGKKKDTTTKTAGASEELTLLGDLQEPTAFPRIFAAPPSLDSKLQLTPGFNAQNVVNPSKSRTVVGTANPRPRPPPPTDDDDDMFDGMMDDDVVLGSDDLRMLENAEQEAMAATTSSEQQASSKSRTATTTTTATPKLTPKPFPLSQPTRAGSSSKPRAPTTTGNRQPPAEIITIDSDSDSDKNNGMQIDDEDDVDDKENMPVETRHVRRRMAGLNGASSNVRGVELAVLSQSRSRSRQPQASQRAGPEEDVLEISDSD